MTRRSLICQTSASRRVRTATAYAVLKGQFSRRVAIANSTMQICVFCYGRVKNYMNGICPACRSLYVDSKIKSEITPEKYVAN